MCLLIVSLPWSAFTTSLFCACPDIQRPRVAVMQNKNIFFIKKCIKFINFLNKTISVEKYTYCSGVKILLFFLYINFFYLLLSRFLCKSMIINCICGVIFQIFEYFIFIYIFRRLCNSCIKYNNYFVKYEPKILQVVFFSTLNKIFTLKECKIMYFLR